ncbi:hypothetical protein PVAND_010719 [Polypedilum vanderplanki]|uniref:Glucose-methanol-choline oxidoreductase N-terminal domain-containing protein n=1 Tax=Polypedilum vanderplanki TaxID=319348 RepID=A0A9J6CGU6_POLVA|nr:hypothetical protein PVAND_010719 [Polypedilum vanderplanki]
MKINIVLCILFLSILKINGFRKITEEFFKNIHLISDISSYKFRLLQRNIEPHAYFNEYDFIIIGSGAAACVIANRLTENKNWNVLMIEAGQVETVIQNFPLMASVNQMTTYDWNYKSERQTNACLGMNNQMCSYPHGKGIGGSTIINYMVYNRGHSNDFDRWEEAGNKGWSFEKIKKYFEKAEMNSIGDLKKNLLSKQINLAYNPYKTKLAHTFIDAHKELGLREIKYNLHSKSGVSYLQASTLNGWRHTAFRAFITEILNRPNFHIMLATHVTKILIDQQTKTAYGVEFARKGRRYKMKARKEVILSAGTFNSPQLLMLSGIGPKNDLQKLNIPVIQDLPVGQVMYDHYIYFGLLFIMNSTGNSITIPKAFSPSSLAAFANGEGQVAFPGGGEALSFIQTSYNTRGLDVPDVEFFELSGGIHTDHGILSRNYNFKNEIFDTLYRPLIGTRFDTMTPAIITFHPKSVGFIKLKDKNPFSHPLIFPNILTNSNDIETYLEAIKFAISLLKTEAFKKLGARVYSVSLPGCSHIHFGSDDYWRCSIRHMTSTVHHQTTTCKMGNAKTDKYAVVNNELKVYGINKLRVADISIVPETTSGHTQAVSYMIGEKAADMIKDLWIKN